MVAVKSFVWPGASYFVETIVPSSADSELGFGLRVIRPDEQPILLLFVLSLDGAQS